MHYPVKKQQKMFLTLNRNYIYYRSLIFNLTIYGEIKKASPNRDAL